MIFRRVAQLRIRQIKDSTKKPQVHIMLVLKKKKLFCKEGFRVSANARADNVNHSISFFCKTIGSAQMTREIVLEN